MWLYSYIYITTVVVPSSRTGKPYETITVNCFIFRWMLISLASTTLSPTPSRPKMPLGYVVYICYENSLARGGLGSEGGTYLKLNLITRHLALKDRHYILMHMACACAMTSVKNFEIAELLYDLHCGINVLRNGPWPRLVIYSKLNWG